MAPAVTGINFAALIMVLIVCALLLAAAVVAVVLLRRARSARCPVCGRTIRPEYRVCPYCGARHEKEVR